MTDVLLCLDFCRSFRLFRGSNLHQMLQTARLNPHNIYLGFSSWACHSSNNCQHLRSSFWGLSWFLYIRAKFGWRLVTAAIADLLLPTLPAWGVDLLALDIWTEMQRCDWRPLKRDMWDYIMSIMWMLNLIPGGNIYSWPWRDDDLDVSWLRWSCQHISSYPNARLTPWNLGLRLRRRAGSRTDGPTDLTNPAEAGWPGGPSRGGKECLCGGLELIHTVHTIPVVPHKAVAEVSKIGNL